MAGKKGSTNGHSTTPEQQKSALPSHGNGQTSPIQPIIPLAMTRAEASEKLAKVQDILATWEGSHNKIIGSWLMIALPIPPAMTVSKLKGGHGMVFCVDGVPVVDPNLVMAVVPLGDSQTTKNE